ncbi:hypothetical protein ACTXT7_006801 [Hymenolepis weldensis]
MEESEVDAFVEIVATILGLRSNPNNMPNDNRLDMSSGISLDQWSSSSSEDNFSKVIHDIKLMSDKNSTGGFWNGTNFSSIKKIVLNISYRGENLKIFGLVEFTTLPGLIKWISHTLEHSEKCGRVTDRSAIKCGVCAEVFTANH